MTTYISNCPINIFAVCTVYNPCNIPKVTHIIVRFISIYMVNFETFRTIPQESFSYEAMN